MLKFIHQKETEKPNERSRNLIALPVPTNDQCHSGFIITD